VVEWVVLLYFLKFQRGDRMEQVTIHLVGTAEEVAEALRVLAGPLLPSITTPAVIPVDTVGQEPPLPASVISPPADRITLHKGPYSDALCAREGCHNKLTVKQVRQRSKYCSMSCAGRARRGVGRAKATPKEVTIVAGEGVVKGSVMSEESASKLPVPS